MIAMASLAELFEQANCQSVETYIQSGNVVFTADSKTAGKVPAAICNAIKSQLGFQTTVVIRSQAELQRVVNSQPFSKSEILPECLHVVFLADLPDGERSAMLDLQRSPPDQFEILGKEIYLYLPNGMGKTKLTNAYFDSKLKTVSTARNWRTVQKLLELMRGK